MRSPDPRHTADLSLEAAGRLLEIVRLPFATTSELHALRGRTGLSSLHRGIQNLRQLGLVDDVDWHPGDGGRSSTRHFVSARGVALLCRRSGFTEAEFLRQFPASAQWQKWLVERIEMLALVYTIAAQIGRAGPVETHPVEVRFPRAGPLDAIVSCQEGKCYGVMRQGYGLSLSGFRRRLSRQSRARFQPARLLVVASDEFEKPLVTRLLQDHRATLSGAVATEPEVTTADADSPIWTMPRRGIPDRSLREFVGETASTWKTAPRVKTSYVRATFPVPTSEVAASRVAQLTGAQHRSLRDVFSWPLMDTGQLAALHGLSHSNEARILRMLLSLSLVEKIRVDGLPRSRFVLSEAGWRHICARDGVDLAASLRRWSVGSADNPMGTLLAKLIRERDHTEGVNGVACRLAVEYGRNVRLLPAHRSVRIFSHRGRDFQVVPDLVAAISVQSPPRTFFVEYEMRATSVRDLTKKLLPWLRYFDTRRPYEDFCGTPETLFILKDEEAEARLHDIAEERCATTETEFSLSTTTRELMEESTLFTDPIWLALRSVGLARATLT